MADTTNYLPAREGDLVTWANNFQSKIAASATRYGLTAAQATSFTTLHTAWNDAYAVANDPVTRSPANITAKNTAKTNMIDGDGGIRALARIVQAAPGMLPEIIQELGLTVRDNEPTPIPAPTVAPEIDFIPTGTRTIRIRLHNDKTLRMRKPAGVKGATLFYHVGEEAPAELADWTFHESSTRSLMNVDLPAEVTPGSKVWFTAFWTNPKLESGPAATPVSTFLQFGGLSMAA